MTVAVDGSGAPPSSDLRVLRLSRSSLVLAADGAVVRWRSHDPTLPLLLDRATDGRSGAAFLATAPLAQGGQDSALGACTALRSSAGVVEVRDWLVPAAEPVGRAQPGTALVRLVRCQDAPLDVVHRLRLLPPDPGWFALNGLAIGYVRERKITVDGGVVTLTGPNVDSRLQAPAGRWAALTVVVDGHLPADASPLARQLLAQHP